MRFPLILTALACLFTSCQRPMTELSKDDVKTLCQQAIADQMHGLRVLSPNGEFDHDQDSYRLKGEVSFENPSANWPPFAHSGYVCNVQGGEADATVFNPRGD